MTFISCPNVYLKKNEGTSGNNSKETSVKLQIAIEAWIDAGLTS